MEALKTGVSATIKRETKKHQSCFYRNTDVCKLCVTQTDSDAAGTQDNQRFPVRYTRSTKEGI